jgi:hypothetical protein
MTLANKIMLYLAFFAAVGCFGAAVGFGISKLLPLPH